MPKTTDFTGQTVGKWKVLEFSRVNNLGKRMWLCQCKCGNQREVTTSDLKAGKSTQCKSCRTAESNRSRITNGEINNVDDISIYLKYLLKRASQRNISVNLTNEYIFNLFIVQNKKCAISGLDLLLSSNHRRRTATLDRINSELDYAIGNVQWVHKHINQMKWVFDEDYFISLCGLVVKHKLDIEIPTIVVSRQQFSSRKY